MNHEPRPEDPSLGRELSPAEAVKAGLAVLAMPFLAFVLIALTVVRFDMLDPMIRPFALAFGKPATALVSSKRVSRGRRTSGNYVELNYQYSPDYAPRPELKVNAAAYAAIVQNTNVAIHYIPGCSSCVALDEDYGSAREQGIIALMTVAFLGFVVFVQFRYRR